MALRRRAAIALTGILCATGLGACRTSSDNDQRDATAGMPSLEQNLAAHEWLLDSDQSSLVSSAAGPVTLVFEADAVSGAAPCNRYRGKLSVVDDDDAIEITNVAQTQRACDPATTQAEREYLDALLRVRDVDLSDGYDQRDLVLESDAGDRLAFAAVDAHDELLGTWNIVNVARDDSIQSVIGGTAPMLVFSDDGTVRLDGVCNPVGGDFALDGDRLSMEKLVQTQRACDEPAPVTQQGTALAQALASTSRIQVVPGSLTLFDESGHVLLIATSSA